MPSVFNSLREITFPWMCWLKCPESGCLRLGSHCGVCGLLGGGVSGCCVFGGRVNIVFWISCSALAISLHSVL